MTNEEIIRRLRQEARSIARGGGNLYRVRALRQAAFLLSQLPGQIAELGPEALREVGLGERLTKAVMTWAREPVSVTE